MRQEACREKRRVKLRGCGKGEILSSGLELALNLPKQVWRSRRALNIEMFSAVAPKKTVMIYYGNLYSDFQKIEN